MKTQKGFINLVLAGIIGGCLVLGSLYSYIKHHSQQMPQQVYGDYNPTGGQTYRLQSSISSTASSITLTSFKEPISGIKYTMSYLNSSIEYATIDPQNNTSKEFISFTGITQNSDNTATLTGVSRGLGFSYPYTASTTLAQAHSGQAILILSNPPQLTNQYANKSNSEYITGQMWGFQDPPYFVNAATSTNQAASIAYVNGIAFGGAVVTVPGGGTGQTTFAPGSILVGNGAGNILASSSPTVNSIYASSTSATNYFAGPVIANGNMTVNGTFTAVQNNTNTIASSTQYNLNVGQINATSSPKVNGLALGYKLIALNTTVQRTISSASTTLASITIPANTISANQMLKIEATADGIGGGGGGLCYFSIGFGSGSATTTYAFSKVNTNGDTKPTLSMIETNIFASTTANQIGTGFGKGFTNNNPSELFGTAINTSFANYLAFYFSNISTINTANQSYVQVVGQSDGSTSCTFDGVTAGVISS